VAVEVERTAALDPRALALRLEREDRPLLISGATEHWPALATWSVEYLAAQLGHIQVEYKHSTGNAHPDFRQHTPARMFAREKASFGEFLRRISSGPESERARCLFTGDERFLLRRRSGETTIDPELAPLLDAVVVPEFFSEQRLHTVWAWFSGRGVRTWLHYDNNGCHNLNAQVSGSKRCWLYPPEELARLHPFLLGGSNPAHNCSAIDVEAPQLALAADLQAAACWHAELRAGDLLFIPAWWFHTFLHLGEFNSNVNFWWKPTPPRWNVVAARQALLDAVVEAQLNVRDPAVAATLQAIDQAAIRRQAV
jgi:lysine-specific demethylase 8